MLIQFSVKNHRAIREKQTFSMVAADKDTIDRLQPPDHVIRTGFKSVPRVLRNACIFGANGSGKTSLVEAMWFMTAFVSTSSEGGPDRMISRDAFRFHSKWRNKPSEFEVIFAYGGTIYRYGFVVTYEKVLEEWLLTGIDESDEWKIIYERTYNSKKKKYIWNLKGVDNERERESWRAKTRPNALYLTTSVQFNAEGDIGNSYEWIVKYFEVFNTPQKEIGYHFTSSRFEKKGWKKRVKDFFEEVGVHFDDISVDQGSLYEVAEFMEVISKDFQDKLKKGMPDARTYDVDFSRNDDKGIPIPLEFKREANGIKELYNLSGPILDALDLGLTIVVDELNLGLHPMAVQCLVSMFGDSKVNKKKAQLIFTTHDPTIVEYAFFERDQIWLVKKSEKDLAARLSRLPNFVDSGTHNFVRDYLAGSYGGVPEVRRLL